MLGSFCVAQMELSLRALEPLRLPVHAGSTIRGGFGRAFRRIGCAASALGTDRCSLGEHCPYHYVFETPVPAGSHILAKVGTAPRPFVIEPPRDGQGAYEAGMLLTVGLVLIGRAIDYLPHFIFGFEELGRSGLGRGRSRFRLEGVASVPAEGRRAPLYDGRAQRLTSGPQGVPVIDLARVADVAPSTVTLRFLSPTCLQHGGRMAPSGDFHFHVLMRNLLRRVNFLNYFHCGGDLMDNPGGLLAAAREVETVEIRLRHVAWERYSARQDQRVPMSGLVGQVTYRGDLAPFWPWLVAGELVHVGSGATFGLGRYRIERGGRHDGE